MLKKKIYMYINLYFIDIDIYLKISINTRDHWTISMLILVFTNDDTPILKCSLTIS